MVLSIIGNALLASNSLLPDFVIISPIHTQIIEIFFFVKHVCTTDLNRTVPKKNFYFVNVYVAITASVLNVRVLLMVLNVLSVNVNVLGFLMKISKNLRVNKSIHELFEYLIRWLHFEMASCGAREIGKPIEKNRICDVCFYEFVHVTLIAVMDGYRLKIAYVCDFCYKEKKKYEKFDREIAGVYITAESLNELKLWARDPDIKEPCEE